MQTIRCLSLTPPWGTLIAIGAKQFETRSWPTAHRGLLAIHQTKGLADMTEGELLRLCNREPFQSALIERGREQPDFFDPDLLPRGAIIAVVDLVTCIPTPNRAGGRVVYHGKWELPPTEPERSFGNFSPGRYAWRLENVRRLSEPLPARGMQGLWVHPAEPIMARLVQPAKDAAREAAQP